MNHPPPSGMRWPTRLLAVITVAVVAGGLLPLGAVHGEGDGTDGPQVNAAGTDRARLAGVQRGGVTLGGLPTAIRRSLSASAWLAAEGLDLRGPRGGGGEGGGDQPNLRTSAAQAPALQAGGGLLVPFRNPAPAFSRNLLITRDFSDRPVQTEPHMAVDPKDGNHVVVAVTDFNFPGISMYTTFDGGENWEGPTQIPFLKDDDSGGGDPTVAFDRNGNVSVVLLSIGSEEFSVGRFSVTADVSAIAVATSKDGGHTWSDPVSAARQLPKTDLQPPDAALRVRGQVLVPFIDKPWMTIGKHPKNPDQDVIYITYTEFVEYVDVLYLDEVPAFATTEVQTTIKMVRSEDGGKTWSQPIGVSPTVRRAAGGRPSPGEAIASGQKRVVQGSQPRIAGDGTLYVAWFDSTDDDSQKGLGEIWVARSEDAGRSFQPPVRASVLTETGFAPRNADFRVWATVFPQMAIGPQGEVYIVYGGRNPAKPQDDGDIFFIRSTDKGATWTRAKRLSGDDSNSLQFYPSIAVAPNGELHVMFADMRDDPAQTKYHIYYTRSQDRGDTWGFALPELNLRTDDTRVTDFPSNPNKAFPRGRFIGDYWAITATDKDVYMVWADSRLGEFGGFNQKIAFARRRAIPNPEVFISPPTGPGGQEVTLQGFNLQPDLNVFVQVGGVTVAAERTNTEGRFTTRLFMPVSGEGAQQVRVVDDSGNVASTSFFTEFGFGSIRTAQQDLQTRIKGITDTSGAQTQKDIQDLRRLVQERTSGTPEWWVILAATLGGALASAALASALTYALLARRRNGQGGTGE